MDKRARAVMRLSPFTAPPTPSSPAKYRYHRHIAEHRTNARLCGIHLHTRARARAAYFLTAAAAARIVHGSQWYIPGIRWGALDNSADRQLASMKRFPSVRGGHLYVFVTLRVFI